MQEEDDILSSFLLCLLTKPKRKRKYWVHPLLQLRRQRGEYFTLVRELKSFEDKFFGYFRMNQDCFDYLVDKIRPFMPSHAKTRQDKLSPAEKLALTLR